MEKPPRPTLFDFHGVYMTKYFTANWDNVQNFKARPDDIVIATYPKAGGYIHSHFCSIWWLLWLVVCVFLAEKYSFISGTTWVSCILDLLYFGQTSPERQTSIPIHERVPFLEVYIPEGTSGWTGDITATLPRLHSTVLCVNSYSSSVTCIAPI